MSIARIYEVAHTRKDQGPCGKCGVEIKKGDPYRYFTVGFRSHFKRVRCMKFECTPKPSERESSKVATIMAAQEEFDPGTIDDPDEMQSALQEIADTVREIAEEYREASVNPNTGAVFNTAAEERADTLDSSADDLESWSYDEDAEPCADHDDEGIEAGLKAECAACIEAHGEWLEGLRDSAEDAVNSLELG